MLKTTKASKVKPRSGKRSRICQTNKPSANIRDAVAGQRKLRLRLSHEALRQAIMGPTPMRKTSKRKSGTITELKYGAPTLTCTPATASERSGKIVPRNIVKRADTSTMLFKRNADSRLTIESSSDCPLRRSDR